MKHYLNDSQQAAWKQHKKECAVPSHAIFVAVSAYCDEELENTCLSLLEFAVEPSRVHIGVCWQGPEPAVFHSARVRRGLATKWGCAGIEAAVVSKAVLQVPEHGPYPVNELFQGRLVWIDTQQALGPCWARYLCQLLWRDQPYWLQIDSHMRFRQGWDSALIHELTTAEKQSTFGKAVLST